MDCGLFQSSAVIILILVWLAGPHLKKSSQKCDNDYPFVPTNLHLQRFWIENLSLRKSGHHDIFSSAAFTAGADSSQSGGLIKYYLRVSSAQSRFTQLSTRRMLKQLKSPQENSTAWCSASDKLQLAEDTLNAVR